MVIMATWVVVFPLLWGCSSQNVICGKRDLFSLSRAGTEPPVSSSGPEAPSNTHPLLSAEVLVKVVELYFCERCGQSFSEASLLSQHQCLLLPPTEHLDLPGTLLASASEGQSDPRGSELPGASTQEGSAPECLLCPICQEVFLQPGQLKEHFKTHRAPSGALSCPERGCHFTTEDRKQLRSHLRHLHGASPVACACRACPLLFPSRQAMEQHHRTHFPFHCGHCNFITANAKLFWQHRRGHTTESPSDMPTAGDPPGSDPHSLDQCCILPSGMAGWGVGGCACCRGWLCLCIPVTAGGVGGEAGGLGTLHSCLPAAQFAASI